MKIKYFVGLCIFFVVVLLIPSLLFWFSNRVFPYNFIFSQNIIQGLSKVFPENGLLLFKKGDFYYKISEYQKAREIYNTVKCQGKQECFILAYNKGNALYKLGTTFSPQEKLSLWQSALLSYSEAISLSPTDEKAKKNYEFVKKKLEDLEKEMKKEQKDQKEPPQSPKENTNPPPEQNTSSGTSQNSPSESSGSVDQPSSQNGSSGQDMIPKGPSIKIQENKQKAQSQLSPEQLKQIQDYIQSLRQEEKQNIPLNKPGKSYDVFDILNGKDFSSEGKEPFDW